MVNKRRERLRSARCLTEVRDEGGVGLLCRANNGSINVLWAIRPGNIDEQATLSVLGKYLLACRTDEDIVDCVCTNDIAI